MVRRQPRSTLFPDTTIFRSKLRCQPSPVRIDVKMTCTATVRDAGGAQLSPPTGKVRIASAAIGTFDHTTCTLKKTNSIAASCAVHFTPKRPGPIMLRSSYSGDAKHAGSQDQFFTNVDAGKTESALKCQPNPDRIGVKTTCNMTVLDVGGAQQSAPTGVVTFKNERTSQGVFEHSTCYLKPNKKKKNKASCWVHYTPRTYVHDVHASYPGDARHATTRAHETLYVDLGKTRMRVGCGPQPAHRGASVHCLVEVRDVGGAQRSPPTGGVSFKTGGQGTFSSKHCSLKNLVSVTAFCEVYYKPTHVGSHSITGNYGGDGRHMATSDTEVLRVK